MRRHDFDPFSLVAGLIFVVAAGLFIAGAYLELDINARAAWAAVLIALGVAGLSAAVTSMRREPAPAPQEEDPTGPLP